MEILGAILETEYGFIYLGKEYRRAKTNPDMVRRVDIDGKYGFEKDIIEMPKLLKMLEGINEEEVGIIFKK
ncbi:MAG: hypothetical protein VXV96_17680 [Bdellovibrionota bacterium]|nr:hypothetical protein [Bdellovibrionota bacterium]